MGPFLDARNENLLEGDTCADMGQGNLNFYDYEDISKLLMKFIEQEIKTASDNKHQI